MTKKPGFRDRLEIEPKMPGIILRRSPPRSPLREIFYDDNDESGDIFMLIEERRSLVELTTKKLKEYLQALYQDNLERVILFGSEARGEAEIDSDVDILIVLKNLYILMK